MMLKLFISRPFIFIGNTIGGMLSMLPMAAVRLLFLGVFATLIVWVLSLPPQHPDKGKVRRSDLRYLALGVLALQMLFYLILS